jgi:hypothetical protein
MSDSQINEVRTRIKTEYETKINKLREEMETLLAAVPQIATYFDDIAATKNVAKGKKKLVRHARVITRKATTPTAEERVRACKKIISSPFHRKDLYEVINKDGCGEMPEGTFSPAFSKLIEKDEIIEVEKAQGNQPSTYIWADEHKSEEITL